MSRINRRQVLAASAALAAIGLISPATAGEAEAANAVAWIIGDNLSLAGLLYARGGDAKSVDGYLTRARDIARNISLEIPDLPAKGADDSATTADVIHYLISGAGWNVGAQIASGYGASSGSLFEVAVKSNILMLLYEPGNDNGVGDIIRSRLDGLVPPALWQPLLDAIAAKQPAADVQQAILTMHAAVVDYLVKAAR
jgi:hypothetical protein